MIDNWQIEVTKDGDHRIFVKDDSAPNGKRYIARWVDAEYAQLIADAPKLYDRGFEDCAEETRKEAACDYIPKHLY